MGNDIPYQGPSIANDRAVVTLNEVRQGEATAPTGTEPYVVQPGDTLYDIARGNGYGNPPDMQAFYRDNPQYAESERNPDLIWPGEVVFVRTAPDEAPDADGDGVADPATDTDGDGRPDPVNPEQAAATTDAAAQALEDAENTDYPPGLRHEKDAAVQQARQELFDAVQAEIETGLRDYLADHPDATPDQLRNEANRLRHEIQGRETSNTASVDDSSMDHRTQQALNTVSAEQRGIDLGRVSPGTTVNDGPYTETSGPFEPNTNITLRDGTQVATDANGYPSSSAGAAALAPGPANASQAQTATSNAATSYDRALDIPYQIPERDEIVSDRRSQLAQAVQRETELELRQWLDQNPGATEDEVRQQAETIVAGILEREGLGNGTTIADSAAERAADVVLSHRYS